MNPALNAILISAAKHGYRYSFFDSGAPEVDGALSFNGYMLMNQIRIFYELNAFGSLVPKCSE